MANQITAQELRQLVENAKQNISRAKEAITIISQKLDQDCLLSLNDEQTVKANQALMDCMASWTALEQLPGFSGKHQVLPAYESWIADLEKTESLEVLRDSVIAYFQIQSSSDKYSLILEDSKKELQGCCKLDAAEIPSAIKPYEITVRAIQGEEISDEDDDILMENTAAVHQVYFKRSKMSIDPGQSISAYMDGSCRLLTTSDPVSDEVVIDPAPEPIPEPEVEMSKPLWDGFTGYVSNEPIYIEPNPEADKPFQSKEFASRVKSHSYQVAQIGLINDNVIWPINKPEGWDEELGDITYFLNHGYVVRVGYEKEKPLFYALSSKGKTAIRYFFEKINKQPKAMLTQGNYPDLDQLSVLTLKRIYTILNNVMTHKPDQCAFLRMSKEWYRYPYACVYEKSTGADYVLACGYYAVGSEKDDLSKVNELFKVLPDAQLRYIVASMSDSQYILENLNIEAELKSRVAFVEAD